MTPASSSFGVNDKFGTVLRTDSEGESVLFRTNLGSSRTRGVELSLEAHLFDLSGVAFRANTATSYHDGEYLSGTVASGEENVDITGNQLQSVPEWTSRTSLLADGSRFSAGLLVSHVSSSFADPLSTVVPSANGAVGLVPAYTVVDLNGSVQPIEWLRIRLGVNNLFDEQYLTKRPEFYPGAGCGPAMDGRYRRPWTCRCVAVDLLGPPRGPGRVSGLLGLSG